MKDPSTKDERAQDSVVYAYRLSGDGKGESIESLESFNTTAQSGFDWLHLRLDATDTRPYLRSLSVNENVIDALTMEETRPRSMPLEGGTLLVLRGVNVNPEADPEDMIAIRIWFTNTLVLSSRRRHRRLLSVEDIVKQIQGHKAPKSPAEFVLMLVERMADRIGTVVDGIDEDLTRFETQSDELDIAQSRRDLANTRRQTAAIRRYLAPQREALDALFRNRELFQNDLANDLHQQTDRMTRYVEDLDLARERALVLQSESENKLAVQQNARMYVLSLVSAIFLPLSFLTGVFGMNVAGLPGTENPQAFIVLSIGMGVIGAMIVLYMAIKKWI